MPRMRVPSTIAVGALIAALAMASCGTLRDGPLAHNNTPIDASSRLDAELEDSTSAGAEDSSSDAGPELDREWAMWRLPPSVPGAGNYAVANGIARDETTGLEWMQQEGAARITQTEAVSECTSVTLAGGGFRLPTRIELLSLVDYSANGKGMNEAVFGTSSSGVEFWSSTRDALAPVSRAWFVRFANGESATDLTTAQKAMRCVRAITFASAPQGHYEHRTSTVVDVRTGLEWSKQPSSPDRVPLSDALLACNNLPGAGWRVPSARELETIVDVRASTIPTWDRIAFGATAPDSVFWSLTPLAVPAPPLTHVVVDFRPTRVIAALSSTEIAFVRCVRGAR